MAITLEKKQKLTLKKENGAKLTKLKAELRWETPKESHRDFDADASAFILTKDSSGNKVGLDNTTHFCFYNQTETPAIISSGDNRKGGGDGEDLFIDLTKVPDQGEFIQIIVTIFEATEKGQNLSQISNGTLTLIDTDNDKEIAVVNFEGMTPADTSMLFVEIYRDGDNWKIENINGGYDYGLEEWLSRYKIDIG